MKAEEMNAINEKAKAEAPMRTELDANALGRAAGGRYGERVRYLFFKTGCGAGDPDTVANYISEKTGSSIGEVMRHITGKDPNHLSVDISYETAMEIKAYLLRNYTMLVDFS